MDIQELKDMIADDDYMCNYGNPLGRIEEYSIDKDAIYGYDSSGGYRHTPLEDIDLQYLQSVSKVTKVWGRQ